LALACQMFGVECTVYMVRVSFGQKPYRKSMMLLLGAEAFLIGESLMREADIEAKLRELIGNL
jgi:predicted alternative tryptophan synthase beta-subunit